MGERRQGPPSWPEPRRRVATLDEARIPMRDGVALATDLYFPEGPRRGLGIVLIRTPYGRRTPRHATDGRHWAEQGFVAAVQDVRGKFASEGEFAFSRHEREDGDDTVTWLAGRSWSNGRVGTYGCSYLGENQLQLAAMRNPHHRAAIAGSAGGAGRFAGFFDGGVFALANGGSWFACYGGGRSGRPPASVPASAFRTLPVRDLVRNLGAPADDFEDVMRHPPGHPWWDTRGFPAGADRFSTPIMFVDGWYDYGVGETLELFELVRSNTDDPVVREAHRVLISPSLHCESEACCTDTVVGDRALGDARRELYHHYREWFDHWLLDEPFSLLESPRVQMFVMGAEAWRCDSEWPLTHGKVGTWYLHSAGGANTRAGDGRLNAHPPEDEPPDTIIYHPDDPVPSLGGPLYRDLEGARPGARDQAAIEDRRDVLVYTSPPQADDVEIVGAVTVVLYLDSDCPDTDVTAKLVEVTEDGRAFNLQEGITRVRYRDGYDDPELLTPGEVVEVTVDLHATGNLFRRGHRIRLEVSSSNFPQYERNLNTGRVNIEEQEWRPATNRIHHDAAHPSRLLLPLVAPTAPGLRHGAVLDDE